MSQFKAIFDAVKDDPKGKRKAGESTKAKPNAIIKSSVVEAKARGKRSDPEYTAALAYIRKTTHRDVKRALLDDSQERDFSDLVEGLLKEWLTKRK